MNEWGNEGREKSKEKTHFSFFTNFYFTFYFAALLDTKLSFESNHYTSNAENRINKQNGEVKSDLCVEMFSILCSKSIFKCFLRLV